MGASCCKSKALDQSEEMILNGKPSPYLQLQDHKETNALPEQLEQIQQQPYFQKTRKIVSEDEIVRNVVKIQAYQRGMMARKEAQRQKRLLLEDIPSILDAQPCMLQIPKNEMVTQAKENLGEYKYDKDLDEQFQDSRVLGPYVFNNGAIYIGRWSKGQRSGRGVQYWPDGSMFEGYWKDGTANLKGRLIHSDGDAYEGEWKDDKAQGQGIYYHVDGARYEGEWFEDQQVKLDFKECLIQHGKGTETWPDNAIYTGDYKDGMKDGKGLFKWSDGAQYNGEFSQNNINGMGEYVWADNRRFVGTWKDNKMHGEGEFTWPDGKVYKGNYEDDKKQGYGIFKWSDGRLYKGNWKDGKQDGQGILTDKNGNDVVAEWVNGKRIKQQASQE